MSFNLLTSGWQIILSFFTSLANMFGADFSYLVSWFGYEFTFFVTSWSASFSSYGIFIPTLFIVTISVSIAGGYASFVFFDGVNAVVGAN